MAHHANFTPIRQTIAEVWQFVLFFKMVDVRHIGFLKVRNFHCQYSRRTNMHHRAKFLADRSNRCKDIVSSSTN